MLTILLAIIIGMFALIAIIAGGGLFVIGSLLAIAVKIAAPVIIAYVGARMIFELFRGR